MDNQMLEEVKTLAAEYGITVSDARHFQLDMLEQYPGIVPFPLGVAEPNNAAKQPDTASIGLDPELVAAIMRDLEHAQQQAPPDDPLERLAEQLEASDLPPPTETEDASLWTAGEDGLATPHSQEDTDSIANEPDTANTRESQPIASGRRRLVFIGLALLIIAAGITGVLLFRPQSQIETSTETTSTPQTTDAKSFPSTKTTVDPVYVAQKVADTALPHSSPMPSSQPIIPRTQTTQHITTQSTSEQPARAGKTERQDTPEKRVLPERPRHARLITPSSTDDPSNEAIVVPPQLSAPTTAGKFVLQVCSTTSLAEAQRWKDFIEKSGKYSAAIVPVQIRDQTYYRVRVGAFSSDISARRAAQALGLNSAAVWIVRVE